MKLLILTQKVNKDDSSLGFFHEWIEEFAKQCQEVTVVALEVGPYALPKNVRVFSLGKEGGVSRLKYICRFYKYIFAERKNYTHVFVHMNQVYIVLGGIFWKLWGKRIGLWYVHRQVSLSLRIATLFANNVFTAAKESFNIQSPKVHVLGHGINVKSFEGEKITHQDFAILSVGRISRIKNLETLIDAAAILKEKGYSFVYHIVGPKVTNEDTVYYNELIQKIRDLKLEQSFIFYGGLSTGERLKFYKKSDLNINLTPTGGVDKVVLEGMAAGVLPLVSNKAFIPVFGSHADKLIFEYKNPKDVADKIERLYNSKDSESIRNALHEKVAKDYELSVLIKKILGLL